jgi:hypothetical protein
VCPASCRRGGRGPGRRSQGVCAWWQQHGHRGAGGGGGGGGISGGGGGLGGWATVTSRARRRPRPVTVRGLDAGSPTACGHAGDGSRVT